MSENQSLSKPSKPPDQGAVNIPGSQAPKSRREASTSRRNRRINRLFTELDQEIIDLDAAPAPSEDGENTPIEDPSIEEELQSSALRQPDNGRPLSEAISPAEGAIEHPIVANSPDLDDVDLPDLTLEAAFHSQIWSVIRTQITPGTSRVLLNLLGLRN